MLVWVHGYPSWVNLYWQWPETTVNHQLRNYQHRKASLCLKTVLLQVQSAPDWTQVKRCSKVLLPPAHPFQVPLSIIIKLHQSLPPPNRRCQNYLQQRRVKQSVTTIKRSNYVQSRVKFIIRERNSEHTECWHFQSQDCVYHNFGCVSGCGFGDHKELKKELKWYWLIGNCLIEYLE